MPAKASPCIGICSTTYGDLVCRGCKRFAHEVVGWNGYAEPQRAAILQRLAELRDGALQRQITRAQLSELCTVAAALPLANADQMSPEARAYEALRSLARQRSPLPWTPAAPALTPLQLLTRIDREFYERSLAWYERSFRRGFSGQDG